MRKAIGAIGRACITAGILILLFAAYQLWGTGIYEARAQDDLRSEFDTELDEASPTTTTTTTAPATPTDPTEPTDPAVTSSSTTTAPTGESPTTTTPETPTTSEPQFGATTGSSPPAPPDGEPVGIIRIPKIGVDRVVVEGVSVPDLRTGPGHYPGTPLPGQFGNAAIAGHRTTYGAPFNRLDELEAGEDGSRGDKIVLRTLQGRFTYRVTRQRVVSPSQTEVLDPTPDKAALTLTTCNPKYSAAQRLVVTAELQQGQQAFPAAEGTGDVDAANVAGLSGASESRLPVFLWGLLTALVGGVWWLAFHRYPRWPAWVAGVLPFLVVLLVFYVYLERLLPSNY